MSEQSPITRRELHAITDAVAGHTEAISGLAPAMQGMTEALLADQRAARKEADRRSDKQDRKQRRLTRELVAVLVLLGVLIVQGKLDADQRAERTKIAEQQRACSQEIQNATLERLSNLATTARFRTDDRGALVLDAQGLPIPLDPAAQGHKLVELLDGVAQARQALRDSSAICITDHPDPTPLDGDRTR